MKRTTATLLVLTLAACQGPVQAPATQPETPAVTTAAGATMTMDASFESSIANAQVQDWSSNTFNSEAILAGREQRAQSMAGYKVNYTSFSAPTWTKGFTGAKVTNAVAYAFKNVYATGPLPAGGDRLMVMTNAARGTSNFFVVDPTDGTTLNGTGWDVLTTVGAPAGSKVDNSAISLSALGTQALFVTTGGYFGAIRTSDGAKGAGVSLGAGRQTSGSAPYIDNSAAPGIDGRMSVWVATTDALNAVGQLHHLTYESSATPAWSAPSTFTISGPSADGTGGTLTAAGFKASPIAWRGKVYVGDVAGRFWEYTIATNTARYWDLSPFSGVAVDQILAPVAFDIGNNLNVNKLFVACGIRVFWVDPVSNVVVPSQNLVLDTATSTPGPRLQDALDTYTYSGTAVPANTAVETISVASDRNVSNPSINNWEVTGSDGYNTPTDGRPVSGYIRFNIGAGAFGGRLPIAATLTMTVDNYCIPNASDAGSIYRASNYLRNPGTGFDTGALWTRGNLNWSNQPRLLVPLPFSRRNGPAAQFAKITWNVSGAVPRDGDNYTFVMRGTGKQYAGAACAALTSPGYYGCTATAARRPTLNVTCSPYGVGGAIKAQPILLSSGANPKLYVANSNALFELNYRDTGTFADAAETYFSLTAAGRGGAGNVGVTAASKFLQNPVTTALGRTGSQYYIYACDDNAAQRPHVNKFRIPLNRAANADDLTQVYDLPVGGGRTTHYMTWDYFGGSLYFADQAGTSTLYRLRQ